MPFIILIVVADSNTRISLAPIREPGISILTFISDAYAGFPFQGCQIKNGVSAIRAIASTGCSSPFY